MMRLPPSLLNHYLWLQGAGAIRFPAEPEKRHGTQYA
jgi:hypothetical protein